jgi:hypothetical protein
MKRFNSVDLMRLQKIALQHRAELVLPAYKHKRGLNGLCYVLSEAAYHLGLKKLGYHPFYRRTSRGVHWWLGDLIEGDIIDLTEPSMFAYEKGTRIPFLTKKPSKRAKYLINLYKA